MAVQKRSKPKSSEATVQSIEAGGLLHLIFDDNSADPDVRYKIRVKVDAKGNLKGAKLEAYGPDAHPDGAFKKPKDKS